ncbi:hypothetical protein ACLOJK_036935 [Asimina triloba]
MGMNQSGIEVMLLMTGEEDLPRVASVINVGLRPRQIWNELAVAVMMNGSDWSDGGPSMVGSTVASLPSTATLTTSWSSSSAGVAMGGTAGGGRGERRHRAVTGGGGVLAGGGSGSSHGCRPSLGDGGAPKVLHDLGRGRTLPVPSRCPQPTIMAPFSRHPGGGALHSTTSMEKRYTMPFSKLTPANAVATLLGLRLCQRIKRLAYYWPTMA